MASTDMPVWSTIETTATLYQPEHDRYHLLITEPHVSEPAIFGIKQPDEVRLIWMEPSLNQVVMTMQGNQLQLRNFTHSIELLNDSFPNELHLDYELWSDHTRMGRYVMHLEIGNWKWLGTIGASVHKVLSHFNSIDRL